MTELMITLKTAPEEVDGTAHVSKTFTDLSSMERVDLLQDWLFLIEELYMLEKSLLFGHKYEQHPARAKNIFMCGRPLAPHKSQIRGEAQ